MRLAFAKISEQRAWKAVTQPAQKTLRRLHWALTDPPLDLIVDSSSRCNLRCQMCSLFEYGEPHDMSLETFRRLRSAMPYIKHLSFTCSGEPLLNPHLAEMISFARRNSSARLSLITNGTLLTREKSRELIKAGLNELTVSLDGAQAETYEEIRRGANFDSVMDHVHLFNLEREVISSNRPTLRFGFVAMRRNIAELPELVRLGAALGVTVIQVNGLEPYSPESAREILYGFDTEAYLPHFHAARQEAERAGISLVLPRLEIGSKRRCYPQAHVAWDGSVRPCGATVYRRPFYFLGALAEHGVATVGNIQGEEFSVIWRSSRYRSLRRSIRKGTFPSFCDRCLLSHGVVC